MHVLDTNGNREIPVETGYQTLVIRSDQTTSVSQTPPYRQKYIEKTWNRTANVPVLSICSGAVTGIYGKVKIDI